MRLHFDCIHDRVSDLDRAIYFCPDVLVLKLVRRDVVACFDLDGVAVELLRDPSALYRRAGANARLCFRVEDVRAIRAESDKKDVAVGPVEEKRNGLLVTFSDPDGNELCLWQYC